MTMTKRIQIPIERAELALIKAAATHAGRPVADWARSILREEAQRELRDPSLDPRSALHQMFSIDAPIAELQEMIEESIAGRFR